MSLVSSSSGPSLRGQLVDADFDLASLGATLWRKRYSILRPTIIVALLTFGVVLMIPPRYQSEARVLLVGRDNIYLRPDADKDIIDRGVPDQEAVTSQAQLILSRDLAAEVIAKLKLNRAAGVRSGARPHLANEADPRRHRHRQESAGHDAQKSACWKPITTGLRCSPSRSRGSSSSISSRKIPNLPRASPTPSPTLI